MLINPISHCVGIAQVSALRIPSGNHVHHKILCFCRKCWREFAPLRNIETRAYLGVADPARSYITNLFIGTRHAMTDWHCARSCPEQALE
jgi:hypothetical protein